MDQGTIARRFLKPAMASVFILVAAQHLGGCVAWHSGNFRDVSDAEFERTFAKENEATEPAKIFVEVKFYTDLSGIKHSEREKKKQAVRDMFSSFLTHAKWSEVVDGKTPDYILSAKYRIRNRMGGVTLGFFILTAGLFPWLANLDYIFDVEISTPDGKTIGKHHVEASQTIMVELFMIFGMPFAYPDDDGETLLLHAFRDIMVWTKETILSHGAKKKPDAQSSKL